MSLKGRQMSVEPTKLYADLRKLWTENDVFDIAFEESTALLAAQGALNIREEDRFASIFYSEFNTHRHSLHRDSLVMATHTWRFNNESWLHTSKDIITVKDLRSGASFLVTHREDRDHYNFYEQSDTSVEDRVRDGKKFTELYGKIPNRQKYGYDFDA